MGGLGYLIAALSAVFNGSFAAVFKLPSVAAAELDPLLFQLYVSFGVFLSSWLVMPFLDKNTLIEDDVGTRFVFAPLGLLAGGLFVLAITFSFAAVDLIGIALAQGVWGGVAILVSFLWGVIAFKNAVDDVPLAVLSLVLLMGGVVGIAFCEALANKLSECCGRGEVSDAKATLAGTNAALIGGEISSSLTPGAAASADEDPNRDIALDGSSRASSGSVNGPYLNYTEADEADPAAGKYVSGMLCSLMVGLCGGSILVPAHYVPKEAQALVFVPSFGTGTLLVSPLVVLVWFGWWKREEPFPKLQLRETLLPGLFSGLIWNISNVLSIIAIPQIGYAIAYPFLQCALLVGGLWGVFVFKEIKGPAVWVFFISGFVLISGAVFLAVSVESP